MATLHTPNLGLPYPDEQSPADVPVDVQALAMALDALTNLFAPGDLKPSAAANPPAGWLLCDGAAVSRTQYAKLYAAIGVAFGAGDGANTFNLPDYRGRTIVGAGAGAGLTARALGAKGGEEAHALSVAEMPSHNHGGATGTGATGTGATGGGTTGAADRGLDHTHVAASGSTVFVQAGGSATGQGVVSSAGQTVKTPATTGGGDRSIDHLHGVPSLSVPSLSVPALAIGAQGGGAGHNVMQPYAVANVFIKT